MHIEKSKNPSFWFTEKVSYDEVPDTICGCGPQFKEAKDII